MSLDANLETEEDTRSYGFDAPGPKYGYGEIPPKEDVLYALKNYGVLGAAAYFQCSKSRFAAWREKLGIGALRSRAKPMPCKEELEKSLKDRGVQATCRHYSVSSVTMLSWRLHYGMHVPSKEGSRPSKEALVECLESGMSSEDIAERYGVRVAKVTHIWLPLYRLKPVNDEDALGRPRLTDLEKKLSRTATLFTFSKGGPSITTAYHGSCWKN